MRYIYMNNFRGFTHTLIPLRQGNFLVGENSTGKSSFLALLSLMNQAAFWLNPTFSIRDGRDTSLFSDLVSAWSSNNDSFQVGLVTTEKEKSDNIRLTFHIHEFVEQDDVPVLGRSTKQRNKQISSIAFEKKSTKYKIEHTENTYESEADAVEAFLSIAKSQDIDTSDWKPFPKGVPPRPPLPMATSIVQSMERGEDINELKYELEIPMGMPITWIAPIRTKPKRIYDGTRTAYSPEGEHAPLLLRKTLKSKASSKKFANSLIEFGNSSGLFDTVIAHSFGSGNKNPFELLIKFKGAELNINNVGYGVSQVLPLIVEFMTTDKRRGFAVQQPEVHLHPKAQAALGGLIFELAKEKEHVFFVETHSDYLIDRYRLSMRQAKTPPDSQMLFFERTPTGNKVYALVISEDGLYPKDQPKGFREFFLKEELMLLEI